MRRTLTWLVIAAATILLPASVRAQAPAQNLETQAQSGHPAEDYERALMLFDEGRRAEATYWFYRGQFRYRVHLIARPDLEPSGDPAAFAALGATLGLRINEWAFGDVPALTVTFDRVLAWHAKNDDPFTPKAQFAAEHAKVRASFEAFRKTIEAERPNIEATRRENGLENRN